MKFKDHESAAKCVEVMNGRWFAKRQLEAEFYDGFTDYGVKENDEQETQRIESFQKWLEEEEDEEEDE